MRPFYFPPSKYAPWREPLPRLPGWDDLVAELSTAIADRFALLGERHVHPKKGGCEPCAAAAADTAVRYLEANTRVIHSEALDPEAHERARKAIKAIPYLGSGTYLRLTGDHAGDPPFPTVDDLLCDIETIRDALVGVVEERHRLEAAVRRYREWHSAVRSLAEEAVEALDLLDARTIDETTADG